MPPFEPLTRRRIAVAALGLIDEVGFHALTVRSLAARLGVQSPSLYNHVSGRDEIVNAVAELLAEGIDQSTLDTPDLAVAVRDFARSYRTAFVGHPEVVALLARSPVGNAAALAMYERFVTRVVAAGWSVLDATRLLGAIETLVIGSVVLTFSEGLAGADPQGAPRLIEGLTATDRLDLEAFELALDGLSVTVASASSG